MATKKSRTSNKKPSSNQNKILALVLVLLFIGLGVFLVLKSFAGASTGNPVVYNTPSLLSPGNSSTSVLALRRFLYEDTGFDSGSSYSSTIYDPSLVQAVKNFQSFFKVTVDGIVGPQTWSALFKIYDYKLSQAGGKELIGDGPKVISTQAAYGGALIRVYCPTGANGVRYSAVTIYERAYQKSGAARCGTDGTAYVGISYNNSTALLKGQHVYEMYGVPDGSKGIGGISHLTFVTMSF